MNTLTALFFVLVFFAATQGEFEDFFGSESILTRLMDRHCSGWSVLLAQAHCLHVLTSSACRLGSDTIVEGQSLVRLDSSDDRSQHGLLPLLHCVPRIQLSRIQVRAISSHSWSNAHASTTVTPTFDRRPSTTPSSLSLVTCASGLSHSSSSPSTSHSSSPR